MKKSVSLYYLFASLLLVLLPSHAKSAEEIIEVDVNGTIRRALVITPDRAKAGEQLPLVFVFHGRTGSMEGAAKRMAIHQHWSDAIAVYPQGLRVESGRFKGAGWVMPTATNQGRDIAFFDTLLSELSKRYNIDKQRVYAMGHSNGGGFTHALWAVRGEHLAAVAPSASGAGNLGRIAELQQPKPVFFTASKEDDIVSMANIQKCINRALKTNHCKRGKKISKNLTLYKGEDGTDVAVYIHNGGHKFCADILPLVAQFFAKHKNKNLAE